MNFDSTVNIIPIQSEDDVDNGRLYFNETAAKTSSALNGEMMFSAENALANVSPLNQLIDEISRNRKTLSRMGTEVVKREALMVNRKVETYKARCARRKKVQWLQKNVCTRRIASGTETDESSCVCVSNSNGTNKNFETMQYSSDNSVADSVFVSLSSSTGSDNSDSMKGNEPDDEGTVTSNVAVAEQALDVSLASIHAERMTIMDQAYRMNRMSMLLRLMNQTQNQLLEELLECQKSLDAKC